MKRPWFAWLAFLLLLAAAGALYGLFNAGAILACPTRGIRWSGAAWPWLFPASWLLVLFSAWLVGRMMGRGIGRALSFTNIVVPFLAPYLLSSAVASIMSFGAAGAEVAFVLVLLIGIAGSVAELRADKKAPAPGPEEKRRQSSQVVTFIVVAMVCAALLWVATSGVESGREPDAGLTGGNASILLPWMMDRAGSVDFGRAFLTAIIVGGVIGLACGTIASAYRKHQTAGWLIFAMAGAVTGVVLSGLMFAAQAVVLVGFYDVAWDPTKTLRIAAAAWAICGAVGGVILAALVYGVSGDPATRRRRLVNGLCLAAIAVAVAGEAAFSYVHHKDKGRELFAAADNREHQSWWVGLAGDTPIEIEGRGNVVVQLRNGRVSQFRAKGDFPATLRASDELLSRYPESAYRSAALSSRITCLWYDWRPGELLATWERLRPAYGPSADWLPPGMAADSAVLIGDYGKSLAIARLLEPHRRGIARLSFVYAARMLGRWDDIIRWRKAEIDYIKNQDSYFSRTDRKDVQRLESQIAEVERTKEKPFVPATRTDVSGRVQVDGRPAGGVSVCLIPAEAWPAGADIDTAGDVAAMGGRCATTRQDGSYTMPRVVSGRYEMAVVLKIRVYGNRTWRSRSLPRQFAVSGGQTTAPTADLY